MPSKCFLCSFTYIVEGEISLHRLPSNQLEREKWLQRISWNRTMLEKKMILCSNHFPEDCFRLMNLKKKFIPGSLPSPSEIKLEIPLIYSEGNRSIEAQDFTEIDSKIQSPPKKD
ncbi:THAP domain-containing protein 2-like isoform X2 [Harmonia axyridis]|uniref:THAP domain-containing protein 2-like isoform X2 n=1 Tax=Harmonia axyridis TaxID=115357 RepID=UPI001E276453|nr:THAP domain-containing protein 2-like isoform X2 [Harmonia axyridis]